MTMTIDDPKFIASWQKVKECLKCLDEDQVERLFSKEHTSLLEFNQALADGENGAFPPTRDDCIHSLSMRERD